MQRKNFQYASIVILLCMLILVTPALALAGITIDGSFGDWVGKAAYVDSGGPDDETSPARADITEFRADADVSGLYLLQAWDNTSFVGGNATTAGITVRNASGNYYRIYTTAAGVPGSVSLSTLDIQSCADATCAKQTSVCAGSGCAAAQAGSSATWNDPFASRLTPACAGTDCGTLDTAVELLIPWTLVGGAPGDGQSIFLQFGSYPSGPAQAPKDTPGPNGITCINTAGAMSCYLSTPTAIVLRDLRADSSVTGKFPMAAVVGVALLSLIFLAGSRFVFRRS